MSRDIEVLVLDDESIVCERLKGYLEKKGMSVEAFTESRKALKRLEQKTFDVVVTDLKMEGPTGMDVLLTVKKGGHRCEVIMITGYGSMETVREARAAGIFEYIGKPFKMADMYGLVKKAARRARKHTE